MNLEKLLEKITSTFVLDPDAAVDATTELLLSGLLDSLAVVNLVAWIEDELDKTIDPVEIVVENFETVASIHAFITAQ